MARSYSQDLRDRVIDAVGGEGMSRRAAAQRFGISEAAAIRWVDRFEQTGLRAPVGTGGHRPSTLKPHRAFIEAALADKPDITLEALCWRLAAALGVKADSSMMSRFLRREGITFKKRRWPRASRTARCQSPPRAMATLPGPDRSGPSRLHRLDVGEDQHDPASWLGAARPAAQCHGATWSLADGDVPGRPAW
jgi:transposase